MVGDSKPGTFINIKRLSEFAFYCPLFCDKLAPDKASSSVWLFLDSDQHKAALRLLAASRLINQAVGDALSGLFLVEAILKHMGWSIHKWNELYQDLPSRQLKVSFFCRYIHCSYLDCFTKWFLESYICSTGEI